MASSSNSENASQSSGYNQSQGASQSSSGSFIPQYSQTPILESIAKYAESMAPQIYQWGMDVYGRNQGNIDELMRGAETYASGQRLAVDMGAAEAGVTQAGEQALENSKQDLASYGIDPSSGRYAALDRAAKVQTAAAAAGAGNMQRQADIAMSGTMKNQAISASMQNAQLGLGAANAANQFLSTGIRLPYSPLGTRSQSSSFNQSQGANQSTSYGTSQSNTSDPGGGGGGGGGAKAGGGDKGGKQPGGGQGQPSGNPAYRGGGGGGGGGGGYQPGDPIGNTYGEPGIAGGAGQEGGDDLNNIDYGGGGIGSDRNAGDQYYEPGLTGYEPPGDQGWQTDWSTGGGDTYGGDWNTGGGDEGSAYAEGGPVDDEQEAVPTGEPRFVSPELSPSGGQATDDVPARLQAGEFVMPDDVVRWKGEEFFQNLIEKARTARQGVMQAHGQMQEQGGAI